MSVAVKEAESLYDFDEEFRDTIATVDAEGKRVWIYPKKPKGRFHNARIVVTVILLTLFFTGPFIKIGGQPLFMFNLFERKFVIFGNVFWPQDFFIFALAAITFFVFVILFTVAFGRLWCGWACPQTIFMEMVFPLQQIGVAVVLAFLVGLEREQKGQKDERDHFGGVRTFSLIGVLGALAQILYVDWIGCSGGV